MCHEEVVGERGEGRAAGKPCDRGRAWSRVRTVNGRDEVEGRERGVGATAKRRTTRDEAGPARPEAARKEARWSKTTREPQELRTDCKLHRVSDPWDETRSLNTKRRWIPPSAIRRDDALTQESKNDILFRKVRGILNKLTPEKFQKLSDDLLATQLDTDTILKGVILLIFDKALDEPKYSSMYAQLCKRLSEEAPNFEPPDKPCTFRLLLLNKCRAEFENRSKATEAFERNDGQLTPEEEEERQTAKRKMLGNIKFIGELGKLEILAEGILHRCIQQLLEAKKKNGKTAGAKDVAEDLECLSEIMRTCGRLLDSDKARRLMDQYFSRMKVLAENPELPMRIRFMLQDVIDLRANKWVPRKVANIEGPMPMHQIRDDWEVPVRPYTNNNRTDVGGLRSTGGTGGMVSTMELFRPKRNAFHDQYNYLPLGPSSPSPITRYGGLNGFSGGGRDGDRHRHNNQNSYRGQGYQNHGKNNYHNNHQFSSNSVKELGPHLKKLINDRDEATNPDEVQLRPAANSMLCKPANTKPPSSRSASVLGPPPGRGMTLLNEPLIPPVLKPSPLLHKEQPILIKQASQDKNKNSKKDKGPSKEEVLKKAVSLLDDHLSNTSNIADTINCYREQKIPDRFTPGVLQAMLVHALEKSEEERSQTLELIVNLNKESLINTNQFLDAFKEVVSQAPEKETTIPRTYSLLAGYGASAVVQGLISLADVAVLAEGGAHYPLLMLTLQILNERMGRAALTELFNESKVNLMTTLSEADRTKERMAELLEEKGLTFLFPLLRIQSELWKQIQADPDPTQFYKWIRDNLDPAHQSDAGFVNALMTVLLKYITQESTLSAGCDIKVPPEKNLVEKEKQLLEKYMLVLKAFLHEHSDLQVTAIYSLQVFCHSNNFPKGMLLRWFVSLYDLEIIEEEAFLKWKEDISDDYPGKGNALFQVNQWLTWLAEADTEEDEEDDGDS